MIEDLFMLQYLALAFIGILAIIWIVFEVSNRPPRGGRPKSRIFACGMECSPAELNVPPGSYYECLKRILRTGFLARLHSGRLSEYIIWIIMGTCFIMIMMVILW
jgi:hypothetical protein